MAKFDMSEYQYSEYEKYMALRSNSKGLILNNSNCNVHFSNDGKTVRIFVDPYFAKHYERCNSKYYSVRLTNATKAFEYFTNI